MELGAAVRQPLHSDGTHHLTIQPGHPEPAGRPPVVAIEVEEVGDLGGGVPAELVFREDPPDERDDGGRIGHARGLDQDRWVSMAPMVGPVSRGVKPPVITLSRDRILTLARRFARDGAADPWIAESAGEGPAGPPPGSRGALPHGAELRWIGEWKTPRIRPQIVRNTETGVRGLTRRRFSPRAKRIGSVCSLAFEGWAWRLPRSCSTSPIRAVIPSTMCGSGRRSGGRAGVVRFRPRRPGGRPTRQPCETSRAGTASRFGPSTRRSGGSAAASRHVGRRPGSRRPCATLTLPRRIR